MELGTVIPLAALSPPKEGKGRACLPVGGGWHEGIARLSLGLAKLNARRTVTCEPPLIPGEVSLCVVKTY
jgi:hypothetical protein